LARDTTADFNEPHQFGRLKAGKIYGWVVLGVGEQAEGQLIPKA
jgi:hypothetical protein